jgi:putative sigma-54 modulation protein
MELVIQGRNYEVTERTRDYINKKVQRLQRHLPSIDSIKFELNEEGTRAQDQKFLARVAVIVNAGAHKLTGEERASTAFAAIDLLIDSLDRRLEKHKGKTYRSEKAKKQREASPRYKETSETQEQA